MASTEKKKYRFTVKEFGDGTPWIMLEPYEGNFTCMGNASLGFDLKKGTDLKKASEIAAFLNNHIDRVSLTSFV